MTTLPIAELTGLEPAQGAQLQIFLEEAAAMHRHLCPRQVLGARSGILAQGFFDFPIPQEKKRLLTIVETDGCYADGVAVATNCWVGRRTMRVEDYGKIAATFVDTETEQAVRIWPHPHSRERAAAYAEDGRNRWERMLLGYQRMPNEELLIARPVTLTRSVAQIVSRAGVRAECDECGEEIVNEREVQQNGKTLCLACAGQGYYR
jgi:formylmethanofuran dehydrogenase subunit E